MQPIIYSNNNKRYTEGMTKRYFISSIRIALAILTLAAVGYQLLYNASGATFNPVNFFSFFTIQSNILAAAILIVAGVWGRGGSSNALFDALRGAATLFMVMTGVIYVLLLSNNQVAVQTTIPWVNLVLHYVMPVAVFADWLVNPPAKMRVATAASWLLYPVLYVAYSFTRGAAIGWYPYPFLDVAELGYAEALANCAFISVGVLGLWWVIYRLGLMQRKYTKV